MKSTILFSVLLFLVGTLSQAQENKFSFEEQYDISSNAKLELSTSDGDIKVLPGEEGTIKVFYSVRNKGRILDITKKELEEHVIIDITHNDQLLNISVKNRKSYNWTNMYDVSLEVYTPIQTSCNLKSSDGDIILSSLTGDQRCKTSDGDIRVKKINGTVNLKTSDGDINLYVVNGDVEMVTSDGDVYAENFEGTARITTSDGDVTIKDASGAITASTSDGDIVVRNCSGSLIASTSDGDIDANFIKINGKLSMVTSDGNIDVSIPSGTGVDLKLKGEYLRTPKMDFSGKTGKHHIEGKLNGGGAPLVLITSDGSIVLSYQ